MRHSGDIALIWAQKREIERLGNQLAEVRELLQPANTLTNDVELSKILEARAILDS